MIHSAIAKTHCNGLSSVSGHRYREYVSGLDAAGEGGLPGGYLQGDTRQQEARESARKSLGSLDELWRILFSALGFFIPMLKEVNYLFIDINQ